LASSANRGLLSIGAFFVILVVSIVLGAFVVGWLTVPPMIIALCGCWMLVLGGMQVSSPQKYGRSAFSLFGWGLLFIAVGSAWLLYSYGYDWIYSLAVVLLVLGALAIAAAFRKK
jgi:hypothetical protein